MASLLFPAINLAILLGLLWYFTKDSIKTFVSARHSFIRDEVVRVQEQLRTARARHEEFSSKLKAIEAEVAAIRTQTVQDAQAIKLNIVTDAKRLAGQIVVDAKASADSMFADLRNQLKSEMVSRVLARAETILRERLTGDDRARIRREFSSQVEQVQ